MEANGTMGQEGTLFLRLAATNSAPLISLVEENGFLKTVGAFGELTNELARRIPFRYSITRPPDGEYGNLLENGTLTGMVGMVAKADMDAIFGPLSLLYDRHKFVQYLPVLLQGDITILSSSKTSMDQIDLWTTLGEIDYQIWIIFALSISIYSLLCAIADYVFTTYRMTNKGRNTGHSIHQYLWEYFRIFMKNGFSGFISTTTIITGRILFTTFIYAIWLFNAIFTTTVHTDAIIIVKEHIDSLNDLIKDKTICPFVKAKAVPEIIVRNEKGEEFERLRKRLDECGNGYILFSEVMKPKNLEKIAKRQRAFIDGKFTFNFLGPEIVRYFPGTQLHAAKNGLAFTFISVAMGRHLKWSLKRKIHKMVHGIISGGLFDKWMEMAAGPLSAFMSESGNQFSDDSLTALSFSSYRRACLVFLSGHVAAFGLLILEKIIYTRKCMLFYK